MDTIPPFRIYAGICTDLYKTSPSVITYDPHEVCGGVCICRDLASARIFLLFLLCLGHFLGNIVDQLIFWSVFDELGIFLAYLPLNSMFTNNKQHLITRNIFSSGVFISAD